MNKTKYTTNTNSLNPNFVTGFCDAEASFYLSISKDPRYALGWSVKLAFSVHLYSIRYLLFVYSTINSLNE